MIIKGKYLLKRDFKTDNGKNYCVHYVLLNESTSPSVARVKDFRSPTPVFVSGSTVRVNSNILIDRSGDKHVFYTDIEVC